MEQQEEKGILVDRQVLAEAPRQQRPLHRRHPAKQQNKENERETGVNQFPQYIMPDGKSGIFFSVFSYIMNQHYKSPP